LPHGRSDFGAGLDKPSLAGVLAVERQSAFELVDAFLHNPHLGHEVLHLLLQGPQHSDDLVLLRVAELATVGQILPRSLLLLTIS